MTERLDVSFLRQVAVFRELDDVALVELFAAAQMRVYAKRMQIAGDAPASA